MGRTIIQPIGPLYGEAVNGTVFGRPNGSVYVPETNQISISTDSLYIRNWTGHGTSPYQIYLCNNSGSSLGSLYSHIIAKSQDIAAYIVVEVANTADFDDDVASVTYPAGNFNIKNARVANADLFAVIAETTYYIRAILYAASHVAVAYSETVEVEGRD